MLYIYRKRKLLVAVKQVKIMNIKIKTYYTVMLACF